MAPSALLLLFALASTLQAPACALFPEPELLDLTWNDEGSATYATESRAGPRCVASGGGLHWRNTWDLRQDVHGRMAWGSLRPRGRHRA